MPKAESKLTDQKERIMMFRQAWQSVLDESLPVVQIPPYASSDELYQGLYGRRKPTPRKDNYLITNIPASRSLESDESGNWFEVNYGGNFFLFEKVDIVRDKPTKQGFIKIADDHLVEIGKFLHENPYYGLVSYIREKPVDETHINNEIEREQMSEYFRHQPDEDQVELIEDENSNGHEQSQFDLEILEPHIQKVFHERLTERLLLEYGRAEDDGNAYGHQDVVLRLLAETMQNYPNNKLFTIVAPAGSGKTEIMMNQLNNAVRLQQTVLENGISLWISPTKVINKQSAERVEANFVKERISAPTIIMDSDHSTKIPKKKIAPGATIFLTYELTEKVLKDLRKYGVPVNIIFCDESHRIINRQKIVDILQNSHALITAWSATPQYRDGKDTLEDFGFIPVFYMDIAKGIESGTNSPIVGIRYYTDLDDETIQYLKGKQVSENLIETIITSDALYKRTCIDAFFIDSCNYTTNGKMETIDKSIMRLPNTTDAYDVYSNIISDSRLSEKFRDSIKCITYKTTTTERDKIIAEYKKPNSKIRLLIGVNTIVEGLDVKDIEVVYTSPTVSKVLMTQLVGRGARAYGDKVCRVVEILPRQFNGFYTLAHVLGFDSFDIGRVYNARTIREEKMRRVPQVQSNLQIELKGNTFERVSGVIMTKKSKEIRFNSPDDEKSYIENCIRHAIDHHPENRYSTLCIVEPAEYGIIRPPWEKFIPLFPDPFWAQRAVELCSPTEIFQYIAKAEHDNGVKNGYEHIDSPDNLIAYIDSQLGKDKIPDASQILDGLSKKYSIKKTVLYRIISEWVDHSAFPSEVSPYASEKLDLARYVAALRFIHDRSENPFFTPFSQDLQISIQNGIYPAFEEFHAHLRMYVTEHAFRKYFSENPVWEGINDFEEMWTKVLISTMPGNENYRDVFTFFGLMREYLDKQTDRIPVRLTLGSLKDFQMHMFNVCTHMMPGFDPILAVAYVRDVLLLKDAVARNMDKIPQFDDQMQQTIQLITKDIDARFKDVATTDVLTMYQDFFGTDLHPYTINDLITFIISEIEGTTVETSNTRNVRDILTGEDDDVKDAYASILSRDIPVGPTFIASLSNNNKQKMLTFLSPENRFIVESLTGLTRAPTNCRHVATILNTTPSVVYDAFEQSKLLLSEIYDQIHLDKEFSSKNIELYQPPAEIKPEPRILIYGGYPVKKLRQLPAGLNSLETHIIGKKYLVEPNSRLNDTEIAMSWRITVEEVELAEISAFQKIAYQNGMKDSDFALLNGKSLRQTTPAFLRKLAKNIVENEQFSHFPKQTVEACIASYHGLGAVKQAMEYYDIASHIHIEQIEVQRIIQFAHLLLFRL